MAGKSKKIIDIKPNLEDGRIIAAYDMKMVGGIVPDLTGNGYDLSKVGDCFPVDGIIRGGFEFKNPLAGAPTGYLIHNADMTHPVLSASAWARTNENVGDEQNIINQDSTAGQLSWNFGLRVGRVQAAAYDGAYLNKGGPLVKPGKWYHFFMSNDGVDRNSLRFWLDGVEQPTLVATLVFPGVSNTLTVGTKNNLQISRGFTSGGQVGYLEMYNEQITDEGFIKKLYDKGAKAISFQTSYSIPETVSDVGGAIDTPIPGSPFKTTGTTGRWSVSSETIENQDCKVIECETAPDYLYVPTSEMYGTPTEMAYGTWEAWLWKGNDANLFYWAFVSESNSLTNTNGYYLSISGAEALILIKRGGGESTIATTAAGVCPVEEWVNIKITRSAAGVFTVYLNGNSVLTGTDTTYTSANYQWFYVGASGYKIAYASKNGSISINKSLGVVGV